MARSTLSVAIITYNEEENLSRTLESVCDIASEIIIVDSNSKDRTVEIARSFGAKVYIQEWLGFTKQKNSLIDKCSSDWILFIDADEVPSKELIKSLDLLLEEGSENVAYKLNIRTFYLGKLLKHSWQPDIKLRLVRREACPLWQGDEVHEVLSLGDTKQYSKISLINGDITHYSYKNIYHHFEKTIKYAKLQADSYYNRGKKPSLLKLIFNPFFSFIKLYFIHLGFLDGKRGLIAGMSAYIYTFLKYAFLWERYLK